MVVLRPSTELVAAAWIASIPTIEDAAALAPGLPGIVGAQLPADDSTWQDSGFVTVGGVGGSPDIDVQVAKPVVQVDCWACTVGSNQPPWLQAADLAEQIRAACYDRGRFGRELAVTSGPVVYPPAKALTAYLLTEPRRLYDDAGDYARYQMDLQIHWITLDH